MSHEFTEEDIAAIANKLFRQGTPFPQSQLPELPDSIPSGPSSVTHYGAKPDAIPNAALFERPPTVVEPSSMYRAFPAGLTSNVQAAQAPAVGRNSLNNPVSYFTMPPVSSPPAAASSGDLRQGIRAFVQQVRSAGIGESPFHRGFNKIEPHAGTSKAKYASSGPTVGFDPNLVRNEFPIFQQRIHGKPLIWFDNAATTQKPNCVIDSISEYYRNDNSNIHRAAHTLAARSTDAYESARDTVRDFLGAGSSREIVFVRGTTEGINLVANSFGSKFLREGDEILLSVLEHHANIVPWQLIAQRQRATIRVIPVNDRGEIILSEYERLLSPRTRIVSLTQASNSLGTILPVAEMTRSAKRYGAKVLIDGAQSVSHLPVDVQSLGCDFFVFSGHKIFGPTGIGAVYITEELHELLPPWQGGGNMIRDVQFDHTEYADAPAKFEAGTPNIADAIGLGEALRFVSRLGLPNIAKHEHDLLHYATEGLSRIPGLQLYGSAREKVSVISLTSSRHATEEIGKMLDAEGIAVRSGHHCAQPSLRRFGQETTVRPSFSLYNTRGEIDHFLEAMKRIQGA